MSRLTCVKVSLLTFCSILPFVASLFYFLPTDPTPQVKLLIILAKFFLLVAPVLFWKVFDLPGSWRDFLQLLHRRITRGIVLGLVMGGCIAIGFFVLPSSVRELGLARIHKKISVLGIENHFFVYLLFLAFAHSLLEEFYWRFFIFRGWLRRIRFRPVAHLISAICFTLHHWVVTVHYFGFYLGMLLGSGVLMAGLIWQYVFEKEKSLTTVWVSHVIADLVLMAVGLRALNLL